eukprot:gnl/Ergobibamus_cyprinoides/145.p1 GENE.gnl/Ergobibamus_cyprinoides/145~~gnl/Ergobibamus_cyprinoides/145.p1  ORF type:complete len:383 (+),score=51.32 gnl/Ergobibamus_cyprinoides/145:82-1230(+)
MSSSACSSSKPVGASPTSPPELLIRRCAWPTPAALRPSPTLSTSRRTGPCSNRPSGASATLPGTARLSATAVSTATSSARSTASCNIPTPPISIYRNVAWTISNLTRSAPQPSFDRVRPVLLLAAGFLRLADVDTVIDSLWAFSYISEGPDIERLLELGILPQVVDLLLHPSYSVQGPALRITGNLVAGDDKLTTACINARFIPPLASLLTSPRRTLRKEAAWAVSNIAVGREAQIQLLFDQGLIQQTLDRLRPNAEYPDIRSELIWIVANICSKGSPAQHQRMFDMGVVDRMVDTLYIEDARTQIVTIEALNFLAHSYKENQGMIGYTGLNPVIAALQDPSTTSRLEQMQYSENKDLYDMVITFVDTWFVTTPVDGDDQVM